MSGKEEPSKTGNNLTEVPESSELGDVAELCNTSEGKRRLLALISTSTHHEGPLPDPETLQGYEHIIPGAAQRILRMAESEQTHRHALDIQHLQGAIERDKRGQWLGFAIALTCLCLAGFTAYWGYPDAAKVIGGGTVVSLAAVFVVGRVMSLWRDGKDAGVDEDGETSG